MPFGNTIRDAIKLQQRKLCQHKFICSRQYLFRNIVWIEGTKFLWRTDLQMLSMYWNSLIMERIGTVRKLYLKELLKKIQAVVVMSCFANYATRNLIFRSYNWTEIPMNAFDISLINYFKQEKPGIKKWLYDFDPVPIVQNILTCVTGIGWNEKIVRTFKHYLCNSQ